MCTCTLYMYICMYMYELNAGDGMAAFLLYLIHIELAHYNKN